MEDILRDLARLQNYAVELQQLATDLQHAAPESSRGADRSGAVQAVLGPDGFPDAIQVRADWKNSLQAELFAAAVMEACNAAMYKRGLVWSQSLERSGWQQRADRVEADTAAAPIADPGTVPPAFRRTGASGGRPRPLEEVAEEAVDLLGAAMDRAGRPRGQGPRGLGSDRGGALTIALSSAGQVSCHADPRWVAERSGPQLTEALKAAVTAAREELAHSSGAEEGGRDDLARRQKRLMADVQAAVQDPPGSFRR